MSLVLHSAAGRFQGWSPADVVVRVQGNEYRRFQRWYVLERRPAGSHRLLRPPQPALEPLHLRSQPLAPLARRSGVGVDAVSALAGFGILGAAACACSARS